jgi:hypothetical protein
VRHTSQPVNISAGSVTYTYYSIFIHLLVSTIGPLLYLAGNPKYFYLPYPKGHKI